MNLGTRNPQSIHKNGFFTSLFPIGDHYTPNQSEECIPVEKNQSTTWNSIQQHSVYPIRINDICLFYLKESCSHFATKSMCSLQTYEIRFIIYFDDINELSKVYDYRCTFKYVTSSVGSYFKSSNI